MLELDIFFHVFVPLFTPCLFWFSDNKVGMNGIQYVSDYVVGDHCRLEILELNSCGISIDGAKQLGLALESAASVQSIGLSGNEARLLLSWVLSFAFFFAAHICYSLERYLFWLVFYFGLIV